MRLGLLLVIASLSGCADASRTAREFDAQIDAQIAALMARDTPQSLATASLLLNFKSGSRSQALIDRAARMAPARVEIIYLQWSECALHKCADAERITERLKAADPDNGLAWLPELNAAKERESETEVTRLLTKIGATRGMTLYWNSLNVMMTDALKESGTPVEASSMVMTMGTLAAVGIPPLQWLGKSCRLDQFEQPGRRAACEAMTARLTESDAMIMQALGNSIQQRWWPEGSVERERLRAQHRQLDYLLLESSKLRPFHMNRDSTVRLEAMRNFPREVDVVRAMLIFYHKPLERPLNWKSP